MTPANETLASAPRGPKKTILLHRNLIRFTGGHLKVWHYFNHIKASQTHVPRVFFTGNSIHDASNPWWPYDRADIAETWAPEAADALFLGAVGWRTLPEPFRHASPVPIINIIQGLSHTNPLDPKYAFLGHYAVRVCVNPVLEQALLRVPHLNGPLFHIPMGLDIDQMPTPGETRFDVVVAAAKAPQLGAEIAARLCRPSRRVELLSTVLDRQDYLRIIAGSRVAVLLPRPQEGFYLPMLEAMAMRRIAVSPDCGGNRAYCRSGWNGFMPGYSAPAIAGAAETALALAPRDRRTMARHAAETAAPYTLDRERNAFLRVLSDLDDLWKGLA